MPLARTVLPAVFALFLSTGAGTAQGYADWLPSPITLPQIEEILMDQAIGRQTRILQIATSADPVTLMPAWIEAMAAAG